MLPLFNHASAEIFIEDKKMVCGGDVVHFCVEH